VTESGPALLESIPNIVPGNGEIVCRRTIAPALSIVYLTVKRAGFPQSGNSL
jgi:hypothetical protein